MARLVYCGDRSCVHNIGGKCKNRIVALNENGSCMGYNPIVLPQGINDMEEMAEDLVSSRQIGFTSDEFEDEDDYEEE